MPFAFLPIIYMVHTKFCYTLKGRINVNFRSIPQNSYIHKSNKVIAHIENYFTIFWQSLHNEMLYFGPKSLFNAQIVYGICSSYIFIHFKYKFIYVICSLDGFDKNYKLYFLKYKKIPNYRYLECVLDLKSLKYFLSDSPTQNKHKKWYHS